MPTSKTKSVQVRLSNETIAYLKDVIRKTNAATISEAIRLIVTERMINDDMGGEIRPFKYIPAPTPRTRRKKVEDAPHTRGTLTRALTRDKDMVDDKSTTNPFRSKKKPVYPGSMEEYLKEPLKDAFDPPMD